MYRVAEGHCFISRGARFASGDEITEKAFSSKDVFLKKVAAGHIVKSEDKPANKNAEDTAAKEAAAAAKKAKEAAIKAAQKKKEECGKAIVTAQKDADKARGELAAAAEDAKPELAQLLAAREKTLFEKQEELKEANAELLALEAAG
jgi:hypothetical protein